MFLLVPIAYFFASVALIVAAIVVAFVRKWRFLSAYFVGAALATAPAFILWLPCFYGCAELATVIDNNNLYFRGTSLALPVELAAFAAALACFALGAFVSAKIVHRWRHDEYGL
jgi:hypothetical protein